MTNEFIAYLEKSKLLDPVERSWIPSNNEQLKIFFSSVRKEAEGIDLTSLETCPTEASEYKHGTLQDPARRLEIESLACQYGITSSECLSESLAAFRKKRQQDVNSAIW